VAGDSGRLGDKRDKGRILRLGVCVQRTQRNAFFTPDIPGMDRFQGDQIHSHDYRTPDRFKGTNVLVIGSGSSGFDICGDVAKVANQVFFSHHNPDMLLKEISENVVHKPDVEFFSEKSVCFKDKTVQALDAIIYCTGFDITLPFLKPSCGIDLVNGKFITPLHKNVINMNNPTMGFIGFINWTFVHRVFDLQARYYIEFLRKRRSSSTTADLEMTAVSTHFLGHYIVDYCKSLAEEIGVEPIPQIIFNAYNGCNRLRTSHYRTYHSAVFRIVDEDNYVIEFDEKNATDK